MRGGCFDDERRLDQAAREMSWEDQNWLLNWLMERLWPDLVSKKVVFHEAVRILGAGTSKTKLMLAMAYSSAIAPDDVYPNLKPKRRTGYA
jgi:hypothetical protein